MEDFVIMAICVIVSEPDGGDKDRHKENQF
jgi:hypothetical protein